MPTSRGSVHHLHVSGIPLVHVPGTSRCEVTVLFRTGVVDESFREHGWTHLLEHLVLGDDPSFDHAVNGGVGLHHTAFAYRGEPSDAARWLRVLGDRLREIPLQRLALEKRVLDAEAQIRSPSLVDHLLELRYGRRGVGLVASQEVGLLDIPTDRLREFAAMRFVGAACVVVVEGQLPDGVELELPVGSPRPVPAGEPLDIALPAKLEVDGAGPAWSGVTARGGAASVLADVLRARALELLRHKHAVAYSPLVAYVPVDATSAQLAVVLDPSDERRVLAARLLPQLIAALADDGPTATEVERARAAAVAAAADSGPAVEGHSLARELLDAGAPGPDGPGLEDVTPDLVRAAARDAASTSLWLLPEAAIGQVDARQLSRWSTGTVEGHTYRQRRRTSLRGRSETQRLVIGDEGAMVDGGPANRFTVRWDEAVGTAVYTDGARALYGVDGTQLTLLPSHWRGGEALPALVDTHVDPDTVVRLSQRGDPAGAAKRRMSTPMRATMLVGVLVAVGLLLTLSVPGWLGAVVVLAMLYGNYEHHRSGAP